MIEEDYVLYAFKHYKPPLFSYEEFSGDLNKVIVLKKLLRRYTNDGVFNIRLSINNIIIILNQFGIQAGNEILFFKVDPEHHSVLMTLLSHLDSFIYTRYIKDHCDIDSNIHTILRDY